MKRLIYVGQHFLVFLIVLTLSVGCGKKSAVKPAPRPKPQTGLKITKSIFSKSGFIFVVVRNPKKDLVAKGVQIEATLSTKDKRQKRKLFGKLSYILPGKDAFWTKAPAPTKFWTDPPKREVKSFSKMDVSLEVGSWSRDKNLPLLNLKNLEIIKEEFEKPGGTTIIKGVVESSGNSDVKWAWIDVIFYGKQDKVIWAAEDVIGISPGKSSEFKTGWWFLAPKEYLKNLVRFEAKARPAEIISKKEAVANAPPGRGRVTPDPDAPAPKVVSVEFFDSNLEYEGVGQPETSGDFPIWVVTYEGKFTISSPMGPSPGELGRKKEKPPTCIRLKKVVDAIRGEHRSSSTEACKPIN